MSGAVGSGLDELGLPYAQGLFDPALGKDSCGVGFIVDLKGRKSHQLFSTPSISSKISNTAAPLARIP